MIQDWLLSLRAKSKTVLKEKITEPINTAIKVFLFIMFFKFNNL